MAKRGRKGKRKGRRHYRKKKVSRGIKHKTPIAATVGGAYTGVRMWKQGVGATTINTLKNPNLANMQYTATYAVQKLKENSVPVALGLTLSYGNKLPIVGKPYQRLVKRHLDSLARTLLGKSVKF